jgi:hypothetical protein
LAGVERLIQVEEEGGQAHALSITENRGLGK